MINSLKMMKRRRSLADYYIRSFYEIYLKNGAIMKQIIVDRIRQDNAG